MKPTILLDGDIEAYQIASSSETKIDWGDGVVTQEADLDDAKKRIDTRIKVLTKMLGAGRVIVCLTDTQNFRKDILPSYKSNRKGVLKPALLGALRAYLQETQEVFIRPFLEADDVMGILSTMGDNQLIKGERIIVSIDKDMKSVPGKLFNPSKVDQGVVDIHPAQADLTFMTQTLTGDSTDGYKGCPGVGPKKADTVLRERYHKTRMAGIGMADWLWPTVVAQYEAKGFTENDALTQARVARICRAVDYDFEKKFPIPWSPSVTPSAGEPTKAA